jgi:hypothetical protein
MLIAVEPNGENPNNGKFDMGDWFRTANLSNQFHGNKLCNHSPTHQKWN